MSSFLWLPGQGPHQAALGRMDEAFPKPKKPMGEAWFLAHERKMYPELLGDLQPISDDTILDALRDTAGPSCFGPRDEWTEWHHYLLPRLIQRTWTPPLLDDPVELIISAFVAQHPDSGGEMPYPEFTNDILLTLGRAIMSPHRWLGGVLHATQCLNKSPGWNGIFGWYDAEGLLSASLFLCLKYLPDEKVAAWFKSVIAIPNPYWMAQIVVWLIGAHPILTGVIEQPSQFPEDGPYRVGWDWSHALDGHYTGDFDPPIRRIPFLSKQSRNALLGVIDRSDFNEFIENWQTDPDLEGLRAETTGAPERFLELYGDSAAAE